MADHSIVDFETKKIESRPGYPPRPAGCAIQWPDRTREYLAWDHPTKNNCTIAEGRQKVARAWDLRPVFHHGKFDIDVGMMHLGLPFPKRHEDTMYLAFLSDPYAESLGLKELCADIFDMPATEQDAVRQWLLDNHPKVTTKTKDWGAYIGDAPGDLVGQYARGDVKRTGKLFEHYVPEIRARGMWSAYQRELAITPITLEMERSGVRVHRKRLRTALKIFGKLDKDVMRQIARKLRIDPADLIHEGMDSREKKDAFNLNSGKQLGDALKRAGKLDKIVKTPSGQISTKVEVLRETCNDKELVNLLAVHSVCDKYMGTFMRPWLEQAMKSHGRILPTFNQTKNRTTEGVGGGARSGRYSSSDPNMQQVASNPEESGNSEILLLMRKWLADYGLDFRGLRDFIIPDEGKIIIAVDYSQQELRILAHFEADVLMRAYLKDPNLDIHEYCRQLVFKATGVLYERKHIKITVFGIVYGMGVEKLAKRLSVDESEAHKIRNGIYRAIPGIERLQKELRRLADHDEPLVTWGGRQYYCEEPRSFRDKQGRRQWMSFEHKMLNYKIQPSAADCTKQGMLNVREQCEDVRIALQVHDELVCMADSEADAPRIVQAMCDVDFKVPMLADAKVSDYSWARVKKLAA